MRVWSADCWPDSFRSGSNLQSHSSVKTASGEDCVRRSELERNVHPVKWDQPAGDLELNWLVSELDLTQRFVIERNPACAANPFKDNEHSLVRIKVCWAVEPSRKRRHAGMSAK